ncbi:MAG: competence/damage-inducible protein A [Gemmataceae bacterium]|nr:competence/damage-inducible protein A [Gemmataceae bacterium]
MKAEILSIGSELTSGKNLDTNSQWLSQQLASLGIATGWHTTIADDLEMNLQAFSQALGRAGLVIVSGGLGPTLDDLTREVLASVSGCPLEFHTLSWEKIQEMFARRNRPCPERNRTQAFFPLGAVPIPNASGTAPGIWMHISGRYLAALPGVPREMKAMFTTWVRPKLLELGLAQGVILERKLNTFGLGESAIEEMLLDLTQRGREPEVGITASDAVISLRIMARGETETAANERIAPVEKVIRERLGKLVYGTGDDGMEEVVLRLLGEKKQTLAVAESVTGGNLAALLTRVPGASDHFLGSIVSYTNGVKQESLGISPLLLQEKGACSEEVTLAMAHSARKVMKADFGLATTGVAGPGDLSPGLPAGKVFSALAWADGEKVESIHWFGSRVEVQTRTARLALNMLRLKLLEAN